jgi:hypothetical protein
MLGTQGGRLVQSSSILFSLVLTFSKKWVTIILRNLWGKMAGNFIGEKYTPSWYFPFKKNCSNYQILFLYTLKNIYLEFNKFLP